MGYFPELNGHIATHFYIQIILSHVIIEGTRLVPMLFKLPIVLLSNAPKFSLLCPNYAPLWPIIPSLNKG